jgi:hypothetical protein
MNTAQARTKVRVGFALLALLAAGTFTLLLPSLAGATGQTTFGANLNNTPDVKFGCEVQPFEPPVLSNASSCTSFPRWH